LPANQLGPSDQECGALTSRRYIKNIFRNFDPPSPEKEMEGVRVNDPSVGDLKQNQTPCV
jgi:hypothetical protein